jgi:hypothetical protein
MKLTSLIFHPKIPELIMSLWIVVWLTLLKPLRSNRVAAAVMNSGITLHKVLILYWVLWFRIYLARDHNWAATLYAIRRNPLCPDSVAEFYRDMLFNMDAKKLTDTFNILPWGKELTELYRERQARCGFESLI